MQNSLNSYILIAILACTTFLSAQKKEIKTSESSITWTGKKLTGQHTGTLGFSEGHLVFKGDAITGGKFMVDMTTLTVTDLKAGEGKEKSQGHLSSSDFFGIENHKIAKLVVTNAEKEGDIYKVNVI